MNGGVMQRRPRGRIALLALVSIVGILGLLPANGVWDWLFLLLAAIPVLPGSAMVARHIRMPPRASGDDLSARSATW